MRVLVNCYQMCVYIHVVLIVVLLYIVVTIFFVLFIIVLLSFKYCVLGYQRIDALYYVLCCRKLCAVNLRYR